MSIEVRFESELLKGIERLKQENERLAEIEEKYSELILHVETKIEGETRHQTALRYIKEAENRNAIGTQKALGRE